MMHTYAVLEPAHDVDSAKRALFFRQAFGRMAVPCLDDMASILQLPGAPCPMPYYRAAVFRDAQEAERFRAVCLTRVKGAEVLSVAMGLGFYPVHVDGITLVSSRAELFP